MALAVGIQAEQVERTKLLTPELLIGVGLAAQALILSALWSHSSEGGAVLGRFSARYAAALGLSVGAALIWLALFLFRRRVVSRLMALPDRWRYGLVAVSGLVVLGAWFVPVETVVREALAANWLLAALLLIRASADGPVRARRWTWALIGLLAAFFLPLLITTLTELPFSPDEGHWADMATSPFVAGGLYARTWLQEPVTIIPGLGWSPAVYGWLLENVAFDIRVGRLWNFAAHLLAFAGIGAVAGRLYGRQAALVSVAFALLSRMFIPALDYRPDHQLSAAGVWIVFAAIQARHTQGRITRPAWHFVCGLAATLSLQLHAAGIVLAFGLALFYAGEFALNAYRQRRLPDWKPLLWFGLGAALGAGVYYVFNVLPVGGLQPFLANLVGERGQTLEKFPFVSWSFKPYIIPSLLLLESLPVWGGLAYLLWRRSREDRLYLGILVCILSGIALLENQGYRSTFNALYAVPVGALWVGGFVSAGLARGLNRQALLASACLVVMLAGQIAGTFISWPNFTDWLRTGALPPTLYEELRPMLAPLVDADDVIVGNSQLLWTFPDQRSLIHFGGELTAMERWGLTDPVEVWERVQPTMIVHVQDHMHFDPGLQTYLEQHAFQVCQRFEVQGHAVEVYRESCPER